MLRLQKDENGLASMLVTLIMMVVISLVVVGFAQVASRNQRQALDRQVGTAAYYAAETGINDAEKVIATRLKTGSVQAKTSCYGGNAFYNTNLSASVAMLDVASDTKYTCLLINPTPNSLLFANVTQDNSTVTPINVNSPMTSMTISWKNSSASQPSDCNASATATTLPQASAWKCNFALLRFDLVKLKNNGQILGGNSLAFYALPATSAGPVTVPAFDSSNTQRAYITNSTCDTTADHNCSVTLDLSAAGATGTNYYLRLSSIYANPDQVTVTAKSGPSTLTFNNSQAIVDSTGKSQNELRRISARVSLTANPTTPDDVLKTNGDICKRFSIDGSALTQSSICGP